MSLNIVKQEPEWENSDESFGMDYEQGMKPDFNVEVKVEPLCSDGMTPSHADHVVKDQLVLKQGEVKTHYSNQAALRDCYVHLERITHASATRAQLSNSSSTSHQSRAASHAGATSKRQTIDNRNTYICDSCGKIFIHKSKIILHFQLDKHEKCNTAIKLHMCEICDKEFKQKCHLNRHYRIHTGEKPYACDVCNKKYTRLNNLRNHNCFHTNVKVRKSYKPVSCEICSKTFSRKMSLKIHKRIHSGQKPFTCEICNKQYTQSSNITRHMRTHTGEMPYSCDICGKEFSRLSNLNEHKEVHSGKKYGCSVCERQFTRLRILKMHEKKYHRRRVAVRTRPMFYLCIYCTIK